MSLPNLNIKIANGALGRVGTTDDGVAGLILTGKAEEKLKLDTVNYLGSAYDLSNLGVKEENNPLVYKEVNAFYAQTGNGAELYLMVVSETTTLEAMCATTDGSPLRKLIDHSKGRIRLVGINTLNTETSKPSDDNYSLTDAVKTAVHQTNQVAESYAAKINPFRVFLPGLHWESSDPDEYKPRQDSNSRVGVVLACDTIFNPESDEDKFASPAIGQVLGKAAASPVHYSIARVKSGAIAVNGYFPDGKTPEDHAALLDSLHDAGYIFYRTFISKNGYYLNDDCMAAPLSDDYSNLNLGRVIDKAIVITYATYIDEINDNVTIDENGNIPVEMCKYFEGNIENAIAVSMNDEISSFSAFIDPEQNILSSSCMDVVCKIVPKGILREINVTLGFENPAKQ